MRFKLFLHSETIAETTLGCRQTSVFFTSQLFPRQSHNKLSLVFLTFLFLFSCSPGDNGKSTATVLSSLHFISDDEKSSPPITVELAVNTAQRRLGLMYRNELKPGQGMLFVFPEEKPQSFWMKNTKISLDIIFINASMRIVRIAENTKPFSEDKILSEFPAKFVLELGSGQAKELQLKPGGRMVLDGPLPPAEP